MPDKADLMPTARIKMSVEKNLLTEPLKKKVPKRHNLGNFMCPSRWKSGVKQTSLSEKCSNLGLSRRRMNIGGAGYRMGEYADP